MQNKSVMYLGFIMACYGISRFIPVEADLAVFGLVCAFFIPHFGYKRMFALWGIPTTIDAIFTMPLIYPMTSGFLTHMYGPQPDFVLFGACGLLVLAALGSGFLNMYLAYRGFTRMGFYRRITL